MFKFILSLFFTAAALIFPFEGNADPTEQAKQIGRLHAMFHASNTGGEVVLVQSDDGTMVAAPIKEPISVFDPNNPYIDRRLAIQLVSFPFYTPGRYCAEDLHGIWLPLLVFVDDPPNPFRAEMTLNGEPFPSKVSTYVLRPLPSRPVPEFPLQVMHFGQPFVDPDLIPAGTHTATASVYQTLEDGTEVLIADSSFTFEIEVCD